MRDIIEKIKPKVFEIFDHLHANPELSWKEYETTKYVAGILKESGYEPETFESCTGVTTEYGSGDFTVGIRADMDALWQEVKGVEQANHSCGHDAHMTMVLGVLLALKEMNFPFEGKLKAIFQPAEEVGTGALKMIDLGVVDDIDFLYGVHLRPESDVGNGHAVPAIIHGAARLLRGKIIGEDLHGARPHLGANAIEVGMTLVNQMSNIHINPLIPVSAKMTQFNSLGGNANIIPGSATFSIDLRAQSNEAIELLEAKVKKVVKMTSELYGVQVELETVARIAAAQVDVDAQNIISKAIEHSIGLENLDPPSITTGGEDFHYYTLKRPKIKASLLGLGCGLNPGLHHPNMTFDRQALLSGIEILTQTILLTFKEHGGN